MTPPLVEVDDLRCHFGGSRSLLGRLAGRRTPTLRAVDGVSFRIAPGETFGLVGESGCGKSTIARCVAGLQAPTSGAIRIAGEDVASGAASRAARLTTQMIFQDPHASLNPRWRVGTTLADARRAADPGLRGAALHSGVGALLDQVGLSPADARKYPHEFSGGQRQRIAIARALAASPRVIVADEPTSALDVSVQAQILNLLAELQQRRGLSYLFISHNLAVVEHVADTVGVMYLGRLVELGRAKTVFAAPRHPYTRLLADTVPSVRRIGRRRPVTAGELPDPRRPPTGCAFHPRCPLARDRCRQEAPRLLPAGDDALVACHAVAAGRDGASW